MARTSLGRQFVTIFDNRDLSGRRLDSAQEAPMPVRRHLQRTAPSNPGAPAAHEASLAEPSIRLAAEHDAPVDSPVQTLTAKLESELSPVDLPARWPLAVSAPLWIVASGLLWWGIAETALFLLHS